MSNRIQQFKKIQQEALELFEKKDYNYVDELSKSQSRDSLLDSHNYYAMAIMLLDERQNKNFKKGEYVNVLAKECTLATLIGEVV